MSKLKEHFVSRRIDDPDTAAYLYDNICKDRPADARVSAIATAVLFVDDKGIGIWVASEVVSVNLRAPSRAAIAGEASTAFRNRAAKLEEREQGKSTQN